MRLDEERAASRTAMAGPPNRLFTVPSTIKCDAIRPAWEVQVRWYGPKGTNSQFRTCSALAGAVNFAPLAARWSQCWLPRWSGWAVECEWSAGLLRPTLTTAGVPLAGRDHKTLSNSTIWPVVACGRFTNTRRRKDAPHSLDSDYSVEGASRCAPSRGGCNSLAHLRL